MGKSIKKEPVKNDVKQDKQAEMLEKKPKVLPEQEITVSLDSSNLKYFRDRVYNDGRLSGFREGVKYIVTLAEGFLVEHNKLKGREALTNNPSLMPTWWIATLIEALHYEPPYMPPVTEKKIKKVDFEDGPSAS